MVPYEALRKAERMFERLGIYNECLEAPLLERATRFYTEEANTMVEASKVRSEIFLPLFFFPSANTTLHMRDCNRQTHESPILTRMHLGCCPSRLLCFSRLSFRRM